MKLLWRYLKQYKKILFGALVLAAINQVFSLLDPQIFRIIVDNYASRFNVLTRTEFLHGVILLLLASVGVAMVSRIAKNFQDYFVNVISITESQANFVAVLLYILPALILLTGGFVYLKRRHL